MTERQVFLLSSILSHTVIYFLSEEPNMFFLDNTLQSLVHTPRVNLGRGVGRETILYDSQAIT